MGLPGDLGSQGLLRPIPTSYLSPLAPLEEKTLRWGQDCRKCL